MFGGHDQLPVTFRHADSKAEWGYCSKENIFFVRYGLPALFYPLSVAPHPAYLVFTDKAPIELMEADFKMPAHCNLKPKMNV